MLTLQDQVAAALHAAGWLIAAAWGLRLLRMAREARCSPEQCRVVGAFVAAWLVLYSASISFHLSAPGSVRQVFDGLDHGAIFTLTAAGWAPLGPFKLALGPSHRMLVMLGALAGLGLAVELAAALTGQGSWFQAAAVPLYVVQNLAPIVLYGRQIWAGLSRASVDFLLGSIVIYVGGTVLYLRPEGLWNHVLWHAAIVLGCLLNFGGVRQLILETRELRSPAALASI